MQYKQHPNTLRRQNREVAALLVILSLYGVYTGFIGVEISAIFLGVLLIAAIFKPDFFNPVRKVWFALGFALGAVSSRVILTLAYVLVLMPVSIIKRKSFRRRFFLDDFKQNKKSVLLPTSTRSYGRDDIANPF